MTKEPAKNGGRTSMAISAELQEQLREFAAAYRSIQTVTDAALDRFLKLSVEERHRIVSEWVRALPPRPRSAKRRRGG